MTNTKKQAPPLFPPKMFTIAILYWRSEHLNNTKD